MEKSLIKKVHCDIVASRNSLDLFTCSRALHIYNSHALHFLPRHLFWPEAIPTRNHLCTKAEMYLVLKNALQSRPGFTAFYAKSNTMLYVAALCATLP